MGMINPNTFTALQTHLRQKNSLPSPNHASEAKLRLHSALEDRRPLSRPGTISIPSSNILPNRTESVRSRHPVVRSVTEDASLNFATMNFRTYGKRRFDSHPSSAPHSFS
jgi:hypothetical protein